MNTLTAKNTTTTTTTTPTRTATTVSNMVICNHNDLSDAAFRLYCVLKMLAFEEMSDGCVSVKTLSEITGKPIETIQLLLKELIAQELIDWAAQKLLDCTKWVHTPSLYIMRNGIHYIMDYDTHFGYFPITDEVIGIVLFPQAYELYRVFAVVAGDNNNQVNISIKDLAKLFKETPKVTRKWLNVLIEKGVIEQKSPDSFIIHDSIRDSLEA